MQEREVKNIDFKFDEDSEGKVSAVFSVFNNLDSDGDIVLPGSVSYTHLTLPTTPYV